MTTKAEAKAEAKADTAATVGALQALDDQIRLTTGGDPGSGLYGLLSLLAGQFLGVPRSAPPQAKAPAPAERLTEEHGKTE
jgi:hypothetical protein